MEKKQRKLRGCMNKRRGEAEGGGEWVSGEGRRKAMLREREA